MMTINTLYELVRNSVEKFASKVAFSMYEGDDVTYAEVGRRIARVQEILTGAGLRAGDKVALLSSNMPNWGISYFAVTSAGMVAVPILPDFSGEELDMIIEHSEAKALLVSDKLFTKLSKQTIERLNVAVRTKNLGVISQRVRGEGSTGVPRPDDLAVIIYTSGTTSKPKGVMLTDNNFNGIAMQFSACDTLFSKGQSLLNIMPPFIAYGFACGVHLPLTLGIKVVIIPNLDSNKLGSLIWKYKPEHMFGVPSHYQQLAVDPKLQNKDLSFIRNYAAGGDAIARGAEQTVNDFLAAHNVEFPIAKGYGMTEASSAATAAAGRNNKPGSVGLPLVSTLVSAFEPGTDTELPIGQRGELCISGPGVMKGYYNKPAETAAILRTHADGRVWVHTGDIGYLDEDGFVYLDSRIKRLIIRHDGFKVFPSMIENVVSQHPAVHQCSVVGCADKDHVQGRLPFVYIVLKADTTAKKKQVIRELERMCAEELPEYVQPVAYKFIPSMPMTPVGKVDYRQLEADISPRDY